MRGSCEAGERAAIDFATERLVSAFGARARDAAHRWAARWLVDRSVRARLHSIADPGHAAAREALRAPIGDRIWLTGEATAGGGAMTVGGAYLEGERAAQAALKIG